jgi:hypothetical protein
MSFLYRLIAGALEAQKLNMYRHFEHARGRNHEPWDSRQPSIGKPLGPKLGMLRGHGHLRII